VGILVTHLPGIRQMLFCLPIVVVISSISKSGPLDVTYFCIVLFQEAYDPNIILERNYVRLGKGIHVGQVRGRGVQSTKHISGEFN